MEADTGWTLVPVEGGLSDLPHEEQTAGLSVDLFPQQEQNTETPAQDRGALPKAEFYSLQRPAVGPSHPERVPIQPPQSERAPRIALDRRLARFQTEYQSECPPVPGR